jgi:uncharacterized protein
MTILWELVYAPAIGHPARLSGREEVVRHATWFLGAVDIFVSSTSSCMASPIRKAQSTKSAPERLIKATGRIYRQDYVVFLRAAGGKIACLREYFDPVRAAKALNTAILGFES